MQKTISGLVVGAMAVFGGIFYWNSNQAQPVEEIIQNEPVVNNTPIETTQVTNTTPTTQKNKYKNGSYDVTTTYMSPGGKDDMSVSLTLVNDKISEATFTNMAGDNESKSYQKRFALKFKTAVIGQDIDSLKLNVTSGASLTTASFNQALTQIRQQALN